MVKRFSETWKLGNIETQILNTNEMLLDYFNINYAHLIVNKRFSYS